MNEECQKAQGTEEETALFMYSYKGVSSTYGYCKRCGQPFSYLTDRAYTFCPYCRARLIEKKEEEK